MNFDTKKNEVKYPKYVRNSGVTKSENYLQILCDHSFLSMWSYPCVYRDQGKTGQQSIGKELCDFLVVFENKVIIFSDKHCEFPDSGDLKTNWDRWYKKAVIRSAKQAFGAERWIRKFPSRIFSDKKCTTPLPIAIPEKNEIQIFRIVVAHGISKTCQKYLGGSGSLLLSPCKVPGSDEFLIDIEGRKPFWIGNVNPQKGFVHILDDSSLELLLQTFDTITDLTDYLTKKENLIDSGNLGVVTGEEDLVAYYLSNTNQNGEHFFDVPDDLDLIYLDESWWSSFEQSEARKSQIQANQISYFWDKLIEQFSHHILNGTSHYQSHPGISNLEIILRVLAREPRLRRRLLSKAVLDLIAKTPKNFRATRTVKATREDEPYYVFLLLPRFESIQDEMYRTARREALSCYCMITKHKFPDASKVIGIAMESGVDTEIRSEDVILLDCKQWGIENKKEAKQIYLDYKEHNLSGSTTMTKGIEKEFPSQQKLPNTTISRMKGSERNKPCPCMSGKKFKKCCGRNLR